MSEKLPGDEWLSGPGVPQGELGVDQQAKIVVVPVEGDGELRHLQWDDPPGDLTPEQYENMMRERAREADSAGNLAIDLMPGLAGDLIFVHGVNPVNAVEAVLEFARRLYAEEHPG